MTKRKTEKVPGTSLIATLNFEMVKKKSFSLEGLGVHTQASAIVSYSLTVPIHQFLPTI